MPDETRDHFFTKHARTIERLRAEALRALPFLSAPGGQFSWDRFSEALFRSVSHRFSAAGGSPSDAEVSNYLGSLHGEDLALACACSAGHEQAWEHFIRSFRSPLYAAARAIAGESSARELADLLYAELYGLVEKEGQRRSLFDYFHGRSKLSTWLRAILAQRYVDSIRAGRREESLDARESDTGQSWRAIPEPAAPCEGLDPDRARLLDLLQQCIADSLAALDSRDRLRLAYYYVQDLTLAQIGRVLGEHEASVSRKLDRTRRALRQQVEHVLRDVHRLSDAQMRLCYQYAQEEWPFDLTAVLAGEKQASTKRPGGEGET